MTEKMRLSYSRVSKYINCTAQYKYSYVDGLKFEAGEPLFIGNVVHKFIEMVNKEENGGFDEGQIKELVSIWVEEGKGEYTVESSLDDLKRQIVDLCYFWYNSDRIRGITDSEKHMLVPLRNPKTGEVVEGVELEAYIDGITDNGDVVEYKTASSRWKEDKHIYEIQPKVYALALGVGIEKEFIDVHHEIVVKTRTPVLQHLSQRLTIKDAVTAFNIIQAYLKWLPLGLFIPNRGLHCQWCNHNKRCLEEY